MEALGKGSVVAVIGSGAMGSGIAQIAAASGHEVRLFDTRPEAAAKAINEIGKVYAKLVEKFGQPKWGPDDSEGDRR